MDEGKVVGPGSHELRRPAAYSGAVSRCELHSMPSLRPSATRNAPQPSTVEY